MKRRSFLGSLAAASAAWSARAKANEAADSALRNVELAGTNVARKIDVASDLFPGFAHGGDTWPR